MKKMQKKPCCGPSSEGEAGRTRVESLITVDERGQTVLPKEIRDKAGIRAGDKLAVITWEKKGKVCCLFLIKAEELAGMARDFLGPLAHDFVKNKE
jgi:AbrB family looped-hinge helix DNA binding protein